MKISAGLPAVFRPRQAGRALPAREELSSALADRTAGTIGGQQLGNVLTQSGPDQAEPLWWRYCREAAQSQRAWLRLPDHAEALDLIRNMPNGPSMIPAAEAASCIGQALAGNGPAPVLQRNATLPYLTGQAAAAWSDSLAAPAAGKADSGQLRFFTLNAAGTAASPELGRRLQTVLECLDNPSRDAREAMVAITAMLLAAGRRDAGAEVSVPVVLGKLPLPGQSDGTVVTGVAGKLRLRILPSGPPGLFPDPAAVRVPRGNEPFRDALKLAWHSAADRGSRAGCILWRLDLRGGLDPAAVDGGSLGAAFAVALRELLRLPSSRWAVWAQVHSFFVGPGPRCAITGVLSAQPPPSYGEPIRPGGGPWLDEVGHLDAKLQVARDSGWRLVAPAANRDSYQSSTIAPVHWAKTVGQAGRYARRIRGRRVGYTAATLALLAGLVLVAVRILTPASGATTVRDIQQTTTSPLASDIPLSMTVGLEQYEKEHTAASASAVAAAAAEPLTTVIPMAGAVNSIAFSPDGKELAASDASGDVLLRNMVTGASIPLGGTVVGPVLSVAFSPNGKMIAGGDDDITFLAEPATGTFATVPTEDYGALGTPTSLTFSPDSTTLTVGSYDGQVLLRNLADATNSVLSYGNKITGLAFSPDGKMLAVAESDGKVSLHRFHHFILGENSTLNFGGQITGVVFSPDGRLLASADEDGKVFISSLATGNTTVLVTGGSADSIAFSSNGQLLAVGDSNGNVILYDTATQAPISLGVGSAVSSVAFSPDGSILATGDTTQVDLWSVTAAAAELALGGDATSVAFSPNSGILASGYSDGRIVLANMATGKRRGFDDGSPVSSIAFSPDGKLLATTDEYGMVLYNLATGTSTTYWNTNDHQAPSPDTSVAFSPAGKLVAIGGSWAVVWKTATGEPTTDGSDVSGSVNSVAYGPGGKTLAAGTDSGVYLLNPQTGLQDPEDREGNANLAPDDGSSVSSVAYSPDGQDLAVGDAAGTVTLYRLATDKPSATLAYGSPIKSIAFSPNGQWLAAGTADGQLILHNVNTGQQITEALGTAVTSLAFSANGQWLAITTQAEGTLGQQVTIYPAALWNWTADVSALRSSLCQRTGQASLTTAQWDAYFSGQPYQPTCPGTASHEAYPAAVPQTPKEQPASNPYTLSDVDYHAVSSIAFSPSGTTVAAGDTAGIVYRYQWNGSSATNSGGAGGNNDNQPITSVAFSANGALIGFADAGGDAYLTTATGENGPTTLAAPGDAGPVDAVAFSPDSKTFATDDGNGRTYLWNTRTGQLTGTLTDPGSRSARALAYSPDGQTIATADGNGNTYLWSTRTEKLTATLTDPGSLGARAVAYSPDGQTIATADGNGNTYLWSTRTEKLTATLTDSGAPPVNAVAFQPGGTEIATADASGHAYLWNASTDKMVATLTDPGSTGEESLAFDPDGKVVAIVDGNGKAYLWTLSGRQRASLFRISAHLPSMSCLT